MKRIFTIFMLAVMLLTAVSCNVEKNAAGFVYNVEITGDAERDLAVTAPNLTLNLDGTTNLNFQYSNDTDTTTVFDSLSLEDALVSNDEDVAAFAVKANNDFTVSMNSADGHAKIQLVYVMLREGC